MGKNQKNTINFKQGKEPRNQLELPTLHFIVTDQWTEVLSEKAIFSWLRMYSWCKRDEEDSEVNLWEQSKVPYSFSVVRQKLKVGNDTFYNKILKPLWNVGLIDIEEYEDSENKGTKPMNIIVYKYPQNNKALAYQPIQEVRNYDTDYHSNARTFAKKGGRPKKEQGGSEREHPPVLKENTPPFLNRTPPRSQIEHINILNSFSNSFNTLNNILNGINNNLNLKPSTAKKSREIDIHNEKEEITYNKGEALEILWALNIPLDLKIKVKVILNKNMIQLSTKQLYDLEKSYQYHLLKKNVIPDSEPDYIEALNDTQFTFTVLKMLETVPEIKSIEALIDSWVKKALNYKYQELHGTDYGSMVDSNSKIIEINEAFREWLEH